MEIYGQRRGRRSRRQAKNGGLIVPSRDERPEGAYSLTISQRYRDDYITRDIIVSVNLGKEIAWLHGDILTRPFSHDARREAGYLLRELQDGRTLSMPQSRQMPSIGRHVHELRIVDSSATWRIIWT